MISVSTVAGEAKPRIEAFYASEGQSALVSSSECFVIAEKESQIVGAMRLCDEDGYAVLRTMWLKEEIRRFGVGTQMLHAFEALIGGRVCFCLPYSHLCDFYRKIGFEILPEKEAPTHLSERSAKYRKEGSEACIMKRPTQSAKRNTGSRPLSRDSLAVEASSSLGSPG